MAGVLALGFEKGFWNRHSEEHNVVRCSQVEKEKAMEKLATMIMGRIETKLLSTRESHLDEKRYIQRVT